MRFLLGTNLKWSRWFERGWFTHEFFLIIWVDPDVRVAVFADGLEGNLFNVSLCLRVIKDARVEVSKKYSSDRSIKKTHISWQLDSLRHQNQLLSVGERYIGGRRAVTLVIRNNFYTIILPDTDAAREKMSI
jgi:hypothetical protein